LATCSGTPNSFTGSDDIASGTIYALRGLSHEPFIAKRRELIHKIGVTGGKVETYSYRATSRPY
jgi:hypothetical protein